jgi:hypothetical protein
MTVNVAQFIEWLKTQPQDAIVEVIVCKDAYNGSVYVRDFDPVRQWEHWDFTDFTNNPHIKPTDDSYGKKYLTIGQKD